MLYEINEQVLNNLMIFLDRSGTKNFVELQAMNEIINIFINPKTNENNKDNNNEINNGIKLK